jgi:hypothetical protein
MSNVNSALAIWQLVIMAVVPVTALVGWIVTIFVVAREPRQPEVAAVVALSAGATGSETAGPASARETEPKAKEPLAA